MLHVWVGYQGQAFSSLPAKDLCLSQMAALHPGWLLHPPSAAWSPACQDSIAPSRPPWGLTASAAGCSSVCSLRQQRRWQQCQCLPGSGHLRLSPQNSKWKNAKNKGNEQFSRTNSSLVQITTARGKGGTLANSPGSGVSSGFAGSP